MSRTLLRTTDVTQRFGGLTAIDHVNIELKEGEIARNIAAKVRILEGWEE